jgi:hypothetical protein
MMNPGFAPLGFASVTVHGPLRSMRSASSGHAPSRVSSTLQSGSSPMRFVHQLDAGTSSKAFTFTAGPTGSTARNRVSGRKNV